MHIDADFILRSAESRIDASSERGIDGTITATNPEIDLSKGLRELPVDFLDASAQMPLSCEARRASGESNFGMMGRGVPPGPDAPSPGFYLLDHDAGAGPGTPAQQNAAFSWPTIHGDCSTR